MSEIFANIIIVFLSFWAMECVAWASHKYIMHGFGWAWHQDHHQAHDGFFEKNDLYAVFGAAMSISSFAIGRWGVPGFLPVLPWMTWVGLGILFYGIAYTLVHDGLVHQRWFHYVPRSGYAKRLVQAHKLHHVTHGKEGGVSFGFLLARDPQKLKIILAKQAKQGEAVVRKAVGKGM